MVPFFFLKVWSGYLNSNNTFFHGNRDAVDHAIKERDCAIYGKDHLIEQHNFKVKLAMHTAGLEECQT